MFISQGPRGSLQAGGKICWVSSVTFIGWELHYISFFSTLSLDLHLFHLQKRFFGSPCVCTHVCVCECVHVPVSMLRVLTQYFRPRGHASGTSTYYICHCLYHVTSIFCIQVSLLCLEGQTRLPLPLPLSFSLSVTPFLLPSLYICQAAFCQPSPHFPSPSLPYFAWTKVAWEEVFLKQ